MAHVDKSFCPLKRQQNHFPVMALVWLKENLADTNKEERKERKRNRETRRDSQTQKGGRESRRVRSILFC